MTKQQARAPIHKITKGQTQAAIDAGATHAQYRNKSLNKRLMKNKAKVAREQERRENHFALARKVVLSSSQKRALHDGNPKNKHAGRNKLTDMMASNLMAQLPPGTVSFEPHDAGSRGEAVEETAIEPDTVEQVSEAIKASPLGFLVNAAKVAMEAGDVPRTVQEALMANAMAPLSPGDFTKEFEREHGEQGQAGDQHFEPTAEGTEGYSYSIDTAVNFTDKPTTTEDGFAQVDASLPARVIDWGKPGAIPPNLYGDVSKYKPYPETGEEIRATDGGGDELVPANINEVRLAIAEATAPVAAVMRGIVDHAENLTAIKNVAMNLQSFGRLHSDPREVVDGDFLRKHPEVSDGLAVAAGAPAVPEVSQLYPELLGTTGLDPFQGCVGGSRKQMFQSMLNKHGDGVRPEGAVVATGIETVGVPTECVDPAAPPAKSYYWQLLDYLAEEWVAAGKEAEGETLYLLQADVDSIILYHPTDAELAQLADVPAGASRVIDGRPIFKHTAASLDAARETLKERFKHLSANYYVGDDKKRPEHPLDGVLMPKEVLGDAAPMSLTKHVIDGDPINLSLVIDKKDDEAPDTSFSLPA